MPLPILLTVFFLSATAGAAELTPQQRRGEQIYLQGISNRSEHPETSAYSKSYSGGIVPSDIRWQVLTKPYNTTLVDGRQRPPYSGKALKKAIALGLDPKGTELNPVMPRYRLTREDMEDLIAYLKGLGEYSPPGVSDGQIRIGVILPAANPIKSDAIQKSLLAFIATLNAGGGVFQRKIDLFFTTAPSTAGERQTFITTLSNTDLFALVASHLDGIETLVHTFTERSGTPVVGAFSRNPTLAGGTPNRQIFYLLPGAKTQSLALAAFARRRYALDSVSTRIVSTSSQRFQQTAQALAASWKSSRRPPPEIIVLPAPAKTLAALVAQLRADAVELIYFLGAPRQQEAFLEAAAAQQWWPAIMIPSTSISESLWRAAAGFDKHIFIALPTLPRDYRTEALASYRRLRQQYRLPEAYNNTQLQVIAAAATLVEALTRSGRDLQREKLITALTQFYRFDTGLTTPVTYGPNRRLGLSGAYIVSVDLNRKTIVPESEWIEVDSHF
ncbi:MAG: ABC transporter substrate-binding protein [Exilibacterium sp.]